jgi:glycosyltransferase involved in cell wall biosynthesis
MIVKNEERNIERALDWAKNIAFEQIVVDTGSTDRTVELAEKMGAKVYHFEWINDFAAAKNFAMDKAKGNWIAILDADEYMSHKDAKELMSILNKIQNNPAALRECDAITCTFVNLDDNENVISVISHQRIFQNRPDLRFAGRIHEVIELTNNHFRAPNLRIMHTGYTQATYTDANKLDRNVAMLRSELDKDPDNPDIMLYLADSVKTTGTQEAIDEAITLFHKALRSDKPTNKLIKQLAYNYLIPRYSSDKSTQDEAMRLCDEAVSELPEFIDYNYFRAALNNQNGNYKEAQEDLKVCEKAFMSSVSIPTTKILMPCPLLLFYQLLLSARGLGNAEEVTNYSSIIHVMLEEAKDQTNITGPYIRTLLEHGATDDEVLGEMAKVYDLNDPKDILFIARAAKESGAVEFTRNIMKIAEKMLG